MTAKAQFSSPARRVKLKVGCTYEVCIPTTAKLHIFQNPFPSPVLCVMMRFSFHFPSDNLPRRLAEFGVCDGSRLKCDDFLQNYELIFSISHRYSSFLYMRMHATILSWFLLCSDEALENDREFEVVSGEAELEANSRKRKASSPPSADRLNKKKPIVAQDETLEV